MYIILFLANIDNNIIILKYIILKMYNLNIIEVIREIF